MKLAKYTHSHSHSIQLLEKCALTVHNLNINVSERLCSRRVSWSSSWHTISVDIVKVSGDIEQDGQWLERELTDRKVRGSNLTSASRIPLSTLGKGETRMWKGHKHYNHSEMPKPPETHSGNLDICHSGESTPKGEKHWTRVSRLLKPTSSAYPTAVPGSGLRTSVVRGERLTTNPQAHA
ncbi:hypothetical protein T265_03997 [Opisthorchis viverrini]|uniref:Uncharacterized protein n=1 Tax=Opisthorchis viverrini TaxID=6198 RepID=A0A075AH37_OPIVI|nr:hypothetical protein T265_03997 [Opisthorchis viverrini]KER29329.1 hypothetical protein T265_03997 [Opisthorchis viverrini]